MKDIMLEMPMRLEDLVFVLCSSLNYEELVELFKEIEKYKASMDFTEPMYQYLKEIVKKYDASGL